MLYTKEAQMSENDKVININGKDYGQDDLDEKQTYLIAQIKACQDRSQQLRMEIDRVNVAQNTFTNLLIESVETEKDEAEEPDKTAEAE